MNTIAILYPKPDKAPPQWDASPQAATTAIEWLFEWDASMHGRTDNLIPYSETDRITPRPAACRVHPPEQHQVPIFVIGVPAIKRPARCFSGSTTTPSQTMRFTVCSLT